MNSDGSTGGAGSGPGSGSGSGSGSGNSGGGAGTGPSKTTLRLVDDAWFRLAAAFIAIGAIGLVFHYWIPYLLIAALPTKAWRAAYLTPGRPAPQLPLRDEPPPSTRCGSGLSGRPGHNSPSSRLRENAATVG